jgi:hypothetical protein
MNNTENKAEIKIEQSTDSDIKSSMDLNHQLTLPGQREEIPSLKSLQMPGIDFCEIKGQYLANPKARVKLTGSMGSGILLLIDGFHVGDQ